MSPTLEEETIDLPEEEGPYEQWVRLAASPASEAVSSGENTVHISIRTSRISEVGVGIKPESARPTSSQSPSAAPTGNIESNEFNPVCDVKLTKTLVLGWSIWLLLKPLAIGTAVGLAINEINSLVI